MNKFVELLEKHCQWVAIGLGGLFFVWILWGYLLTSPVALEAPGRDSLTPGTVDSEVAKAADQLRGRIDSQVVKMPPTVASQDPYLGFVKEMEGGVVPVLAGEIFGPEKTGIIVDPKRVPDMPNQDKVAALPELPPAEVLPGEGLKGARAQILPAPAIVAGGQPAPPPAPGVTPVDARDISYVRGEYRIDPALIAQAFDDKKIPAGLPTMIVGIEVYRQEKLPDGTWTKEEPVKLIKNNIIPWPLPPANAGFQQVGQFQAWAESPQGQADLLRPSFYQVLMGEGPWDAPQNLDDVKKLVDAENEALKAARIEEQKRKAEEAKARRQATPQGPPPDGMPPEGRRGRRGGPGGGDFQAADPDRPNGLADLAGLQLAQARPPGYPPNYPLPPGYPGGAGRPPMNPDDPGFMEEGMQPMPIPGQGAPGAPTAGALPAALFVPKGAPVIIGWFYDENVVEGHTYRYQVRYAIKNPMYLHNQVANPALAQQFAIWSTLDKDAWSEERTIETSTRYYLANAGWQGNPPGNVRVEVFKWAAGRWQSKIFQTAIGDTIGQKDGGIEFGTASMLVDVRFDDRLDRAYVLVLGPDGQLTEREPILDRNDPDRAALQLLVKSAMPPAIGAAGGPGAPVAGR